jgi:hypothetical protein
MVLPALIFVTQLVNAQAVKTFQWIGGPTYVLHLGSFKVLTDPMLCPKGDSAFIINNTPYYRAVKRAYYQVDSPRKV